MPWIQASNGSDYTERMAVSVDTTGATPGGPAVGVLLAIGPNATKFWEKVQANGYDIRIATAAGGIIPHERNTWVYASKAAILRFEYTLPATALAGARAVVYIYFAPLTVVSSDPSAGPFATTVTAEVTPPLVLVPNQHPVLTGPSWALPTSSNTPAPTQTIGTIVNERRRFVLDMGRGFTYASGWSLYGSDARTDVEWIHAESTGVAVSAPTWVTSAGVRVWVDESGTQALGQIDCDDASDALAVVTVGWSSGEEVKYAFKIVGLDPTI